MLDYGNIYSLGELKTYGATYKELGDYNRTFTSFTLDMKNCNSAGYAFKQNGKEYRAVIVRENGKQYMKVLSPDDKSHKVNSVIEISPDCSHFNIEIVSDGEFCEFFVNGEYALTAHTAMTGSSHSAYLYSDGEAEFTNVKINKLIPYGEI